MSNKVKEYNIPMSITNNLELVKFIENNTGSQYYVDCSNRQFHIDDDDWSPSILRKEEILTEVINYFDSIGLYFQIKPFLHGDKTLYMSIYKKRVGVNSRSIHISVENTRDEAMTIGLNYMLENLDIL